MIRSSIFLLIVALSACSSNHPQDPIEPINRGIFHFNDTIDRFIIKPISQVYDAIVVNDVQLIIVNFFSNLNEPLRFVNDVLQLNGQGASDDLHRFWLNSTLGVFGLNDVASQVADIQKRPQDFGMTLAMWTGNAKTPFLMIPFVGPSTLRDTIGKIPESALAYYTTINADSWIIDSADILEVVNNRAQYLKYEDLMALQLDRYIAVREAYLTKRNKIYEQLRNE